MVLTCCEKVLLSRLGEKPWLPVTNCKVDTVGVVDDPALRSKVSGVVRGSASWAYGLAAWLVHLAPGLALDRRSGVRDARGRGRT